MDPRDFFSQAISEIHDMFRALWQFADRRPAVLLAVGAILIYVAARRRNDLKAGLLGLTGIAIFVYLMKLVVVK
jgi:hypothetical protein